MMKESLNYEWHLLREAEDGTANAGSDGALWLPSQGRTILQRTGPIAIVADGVSQEKGKGILAINAFLRLLEQVRNFNEAYFRLFAKEVKIGPGDPKPGKIFSTFLTAQFPLTTADPLEFLHAGDSLMVRLRNESATIMTREHSYWAEGTVSFLPPEMVELRTAAQLSLKYTEHEMRECYKNLLRNLREEAITTHHERLERAKKRVKAMSNNTPDTTNPAWLLDFLLWHCRSIVTHDLSDSRNKAERIMRSETTKAWVHPGDKYALFTDGIFPDVVGLKVVERVLKISKTAKEACERLMRYATQLGIKRDDRTVLVTVATKQDDPKAKSEKNGNGSNQI